MATRAMPGCQHNAQGEAPRPEHFVRHGPGPGSHATHANVCTRYSGGVIITFALDESLVAAAKATAGRHGTSISALVSTALEQQVAVDAEIAAGGASGVLQTLLEYAMGRVPRIVAMQRLGIEDYAVLMCLLNAARLPHPIVPLAKRNEMAAGMVAAIKALGPSA